MPLLQQVHWVALLPLLAAVAVLLLGREGPRSKMPYLSLAAMGWCLVHSARLLLAALSGGLELPYAASIPWFDAGPYPFSLGVLVDGLSVVMLFVVTLVSFLVQLYSLGYMHGEPRFKRFYAYVSFFTASMLGLVLSSSLLVAFCCWELMGVSSYLLIGFWFEKPGPAYASKKAFITTKLGDLGFYLGLLLLFAQLGTLDLAMLRERAALGPAYLPVGTATAAGLLLLGGTIGKSAQWPLFIWLPDAMEGPTPVSALIHAATMVAAGIFLVARTYFLYQAAPLALETAAWVGLLTAFLAATMAVTANDIKRVLAFSTVSQLGYMLLALGAGGYAPGLFHLTTHAFFKALLFLGAGSVIHAVHTNDMRQMGGLSRKMPATFLAMTAGTLAIIGMPPFAGFYSKEAVLAAVYAHNPLMWGIALFTAGLTTFYMTRLMLLTFWGAPRDRERVGHAHESPWVMTLPLWTLAALALASGFLLERHGAFEALVGPSGALAHGEAAAARAEGGGHPAFLLYGALGALAAGLGLALRLYGGDLSLAGSLRARFSWLAGVLENRYGFDDFFLRLVDWSDRLARACFWIDEKLIDRVFVDGWGLLTQILAEIQNFIDAFFVDGAVDAVGSLTRGVGQGLRALVRGQVQEYLLYLALALSLLILRTLTH